MIDWPLVVLLGRKADALYGGRRALKRWRIEASESFVAPLDY